MGLISEVKCSRCDRRYSGLRSRCPYCGARKRKRGKRVAEEDNAVWKLVVGLLVVVALIAAVVVLLVTSLGDKDDTGSTVTDPPSTASYSAGDGVTEITSSPEPSPSETTTPTPTPTPVLQAVAITIYGGTTTDATLDLGVKYDFNYSTTPSDYVGGTPVWSSSDESVFVILQTGEATAVGSGTATLTVTLDGVSTTCIIRVK